MLDPYLVSLLAWTGYLLIVTVLLMASILTLLFSFFFIFFCCFLFFFLMIRRPPRSTLDRSSAASDVYKRQSLTARFDIAVNTLKLQALGLMDRALNFNGNLKGRAAFHPDGYGSFQLNADSLRMANNERDFQFERFLAKGLLNTDSTAFEIESDAITLAYHTNLSIDSLLPSTREKLISLFTADTTFIARTGKRMDLAITLPRTEWLTGLLVPQLQAIELENFSGTYDSNADVIDLTIDMPLLVYDSIRVKELHTTVKAERAVLNGDITIAHIQRDSLYICLLYTSDAADERSSVDLGGRRIIKKKNKHCAAEHANTSQEEQTDTNTKREP